MTATADRYIVQPVRNVPGEWMVVDMQTMRAIRFTYNRADADALAASRNRLHAAVVAKRNFVKGV